MSTAQQPGEHNQRIETLELKIMDLENTVQELHQVLLKQYQDIDRLQQQLKLLMQRMEGSNSAQALPTASDEVPPHY